MGIRRGQGLGRAGVITPITTYTLSGIVESYSLRTFNGLGLTSSGRVAGTTGSPRNLIIDQVSLSAAAQEIMAARSEPFAARTSGLKALTQGGLDFTDVDISGAAFVGQILDGATFTNAVLRDVNFTGASLAGARFVSSAVDGARFNQANLSGADLAGAKGLRFEQVQGAITDASTILPKSVGNLITGTFGAAGGTPFLFGV